ncbi:hypothetical protein [Clostridium septicum]|uniref:Uncharacterized protein n=1 Tax=Clostridium septicum TaxID=1504 RepID=A0A9N7JMC0_CLOSE|nr:hypothetical protein [Clostridium septicum]AYE34975.1 hypothetical protein CP523_11430 [Clostridium septicum]MDU1314635.1 hypothetical protein [Clostridium septicum]QAS60368.1 hypothetical protein EI377_06245 [Clostridium septicum]UEC20376.1 hypothetical protein LK444_13395 [Clostridium septicum]USS01569.1 hypothetical protein NH397_03780 [Clostridium septicum]
MTLSLLHYVYIVFTILILIWIFRKRDITIICIIGIFLMAILSSRSLPLSIMSIFNGFSYAIVELLPVILIISIITAFSKLLSATEINEMMIKPLTKFIKNKSLAYWIIGISMMIISWFFWPSPAVALIGAVLIPVAKKAGLPSLATAMAMNLFGHGIALSSDIIIQGASKLTANAAGISIDELYSSLIPLEIVMGLTTTIIAYFIIMKDIKNNNMVQENNSDNKSKAKDKPLNKLSDRKKRFYALLVFLGYLFDVILMCVFSIKGGDATALVGGTTLFLLIVIFLGSFKFNSVQQITPYITDGFQFAFKVFGAVIPVATFFYIGGSGFSDILGVTLPANSQGIINDLGIALANAVPLNKAVATATVSGVGILTGLDGSGFSGLSLVGSSAMLFSSSVAVNTSTLASLGQICTIWIGGGTLIPWALIPVAAICDVSPFDLARKNIIPVTIGLITTLIYAIIFLA